MAAQLPQQITIRTVVRILARTSELVATNFYEEEIATGTHRKALQPIKTLSR